MGGWGFWRRGGGEGKRKKEASEPSFLIFPPPVGKGRGKEKRSSGLNSPASISGASTPPPISSASRAGAALPSLENIHSGSAMFILEDCWPSGCPYFS